MPKKMKKISLGQKNTQINTPKKRSLRFPTYFPASFKRYSRCDSLKALVESNGWGAVCLGLMR